MAVVDKLRELGATLKPMPARPNVGNISGLGVESAAAFDSYIGSLPPEYVDSVLAANARCRGRGGGGGGGGQPGHQVPRLLTPAGAAVAVAVVVVRPATIHPDQRYRVSGVGARRPRSTTCRPSAVAMSSSTKWPR